ncbi:MAG: YncE family protein [Nitrososphaerales archaeon]|nr:YncE family protein [Nitrososphaerales archaeon]
MKLVVALAVLLLLAVPSAHAQSGIVNVDYGRSWPLSLAVDSARGVVYVDGESGIYPPIGFSFGIINASTDALERVLPLPSTPGEMALDGSTGTVYVAGDRSVSVFDWKTQSFDRTIQLKLPVFDMVFDNVTGDIIFTSGNAVYQLDPTTGSVLGNATVGNAAEGIAIDETKGKIYVANYLSGSISVLGSADLSIIKTIQLPEPAYPSALVLNRLGNELFASTDENSVVVIDTSTESIVRSIVLGQTGVNGTSVLAIDERSNDLFVATNPGDTIVEVDAYSGGVFARYTVASTVYEMTVDQATRKLYVTNYHQVSVISPQYGRVTGSTPILAALIVAVVAVVALAGALYFRRVTASGGMRGGLPSQPRTPLS